VKDELKSSRGDPKGHVAISIPATAADLLLPEIVRRAEQRFPGVTLTVWDGLSREGGQAIELGKVDFGVVPNAEELEHVEAEPIFTEALYWVGASAPGTPDTITLAEAAATRLVLPPRTLHLRRRIEQAAMEAAVPLAAAYEQQSAPGIASLVRAGLAATISNWPPLSILLEPTTARRIVEPRISRTIALAHSQHKPLSFAAGCLRDLVRSVLIDLVNSGRWRGELIGKEAEPLETVLGVQLAV